MEFGQSDTPVQSRRQLREQESLATTVRPEMPTQVAARLDTGPVYTVPSSSNSQPSQTVEVSNFSQPQSRLSRRAAIRQETAAVEPVIQIPVVQVPVEQVQQPAVEQVQQQSVSSRRSRRMLEESGLIQIVPEHLQRPAIATQEVPVQVTDSGGIIQVPDSHWQDSAEIARRIERGISEDKATLVVPQPAPANLTGPILTTGEILLTGSVEIPRSLSTTGAIIPVDSAEVDLDTVDASDEQTSDVLPVRASAAVGTRDSDLLKAKVPNKITFTSVIIALAVGAAAFALTYFATAYFLGWLG
ncbi:MAG: hypothetical protein KF916_05865 [Microbacteriaceae bacterium]|nr:hypothetical protein [Microbacteriaceae bacterium]